LTAVYSGDSTFAGSTSAVLGQTLKKAATQVTLTSSGAAPVRGQAVTFTATVAAVSPGSGTPTGTVTFTNNGVVLGTATIHGGVATFTTSALTVGAHTIKAAYGGDADFTASSRAISQMVKKYSTAITASATAAVLNQPVTLTATVASSSPGSGTPTGTVTFKDATTGKVLGTATLTGGKATLSGVTFTTRGKHKITVTYGGDGNDLASATSLILTV
jgi:hypothetical protein